MTSPASRRLVDRQRTFLAALLALADIMEEALYERDAPTIVSLSERRRALVDGAASFVPPWVPWAPPVAELAGEVEARTAEVQRGLDALIAELRREAST